MGRITFMTAGFIASVAFAMLGRPEMARIVYGLVIFLLNSLVNGVPMFVAYLVHYPGTNQALAGIYPLAGTLILGLYYGGTCLWRQDRIFKGRVSVFLVVTVSCTILVILDGQLVYGGGDFWLFIGTRGAWLEVIMFLVMWTFITGVRRRAVRKAWQSIQVDMVTYDSLWESIVKDPCAEQTLSKLAQFVHLYGESIQCQPGERATVQHTCVPGAASSLDCLFPSAAAAVSGRLRIHAAPAAHTPCCSRPGTPGMRLPVSSLDQLYLQAHLIWPIFNKYIAKWAAQCNGKLVLDDQTLAPWAELERCGRVEEVKWAGIKSVRRSIEKLQRSYKSDVSRLVDVVRQSIVFASLDDMCSCLSAISQDPSVRSLRIKNRMQPTSAAATGGYRDVAVNLVIVDEDTERFRVSGHVCELQLILESYYRLKTDVGHSRYVAYRNQRAE